MIIDINFYTGIKAEVYNLNCFKRFSYYKTAIIGRCLLRCGLPSVDIFPCGGTAESRKMQKYDF